MTASGAREGAASQGLAPSRAARAPDSDALAARDVTSRDVSGGLDCHTVTRVVQEALEALRTLDGRKAEALLSGLLDELEGQE